MPPVQFNANVSAVKNNAQGQTAPKLVENGASFGDALQAQILKQSGVTLSAHAQKRLAERNVHLDDNAQARLGAAVDKIQEKGADKSLVLMDNLAFVVSARNRTVITALDSQSAKEGVFTNIESAVII